MQIIFVVVRMMNNNYNKNYWVIIKYQALCHVREDYMKIKCRSYFHSPYFRDEKPEA